MSVFLRVATATLLTTLITTPAAAQATDVDWTHGTTVGFEGGVTTGSGETGPHLAGALGWELTPTLKVEGSARWLDRGAEGDAFNAALKIRAGLLQTAFAPFVEGGFGLYRLTTEASGDLPAFYRQRMANNEAGILTQTFTDPVFHLGAGVNLFTSRHIALQPAAEMLIVVAEGERQTLGVFSLRLIYHFEDHPVTPSRR